MSEIKSGIYEHYKGKRYQVFGVARHSETEDVVVVYQPLYGEPSLWIRPFDMFTESVWLPDGEQVPRFRFLRPAASPVPLADLD